MTLRQDEEPCRTVFPSCPGLPGPSSLLSHRLCYRSLWFCRCLSGQAPPAVWTPSCPWVRPVGTGSVVVWVQGSPPSLLHMYTEEWEVLRGAGGQDTLPAAYLGCFPDHSP